MASIDDLVSAMDCDQTVPRVEGTPGGSIAGYKRWTRWLDCGGVKSYAKRRNDALDPAGASRMSAYLNLGMVSPFRIAREARAAGQVRGSKTGCNKFEKEFLVWRGLAFAWCFHFSPTVAGQVPISEFFARPLVSLLLNSILFRPLISFALKFCPVLTVAQGRRRSLDRAPSSVGSQHPAQAL